MTKRVYSTSHALAHCWANDAVLHDGRIRVARSGNTSYERYPHESADVLVFYSYSAPIGLRIAARGDMPAMFILSSEKFSHTTQRHEGELLSATQNAVRFSVHTLPIDILSGGERGTAAWRVVYAAVLRDAEANLRKAATAQSRAAQYITNAGSGIDQYNKLCAAMIERGLPSGPLMDVSTVMDIDLEQLAAMMKAESDRRKQEDTARSAAQHSAHAAYVNWWRSGGDGVMPDGAIPPPTEAPAALRLSTDRLTVETIRAASIPVSAAKRLWPVLCEARTTATSNGALLPTTVTNAVGMRLGGFTLNTITAKGDILVGCHSITFDEMASIAKQLGLPEATA